MILSIIIPVYHVERTLDRCVEGVLRQDLDDFEVILVDDGGDDNCPRMCDEWADVTLMYVSSTKATRDSLLLAMRA